MANETTVDTIKAVLTAEIGQLQQQMAKAAESIESVARSASKLGTQSSQGFSTFQAQVVSLNAALDLLTKGYNLLKGAAMSTVGAASDQQQAVSQLNSAMKSAGTYSDALSQAYQRQAKEFQNTTRFSDEAAMGVQKLLIEAKAAPADMKPFVQAILDAAAGGKGLEQTTSAVAAAFQGRFYPAARLLKIQIDQNASAAANLDLIYRKMRENWAGAAARDLETYGGSVAQLKNLYDELLESVGQGVIELPAFKQVLADVRDEMKSSEADAYAKALGAGLGGVVANLIGVFRDLVTGIGDVGRTIGEFNPALNESKEFWIGVAGGVAQLTIGLGLLAPAIYLVEGAFKTMLAHPVIAALAAEALIVEFVTSKIKNWALAHDATAQAALDAAQAEASFAAAGIKITDEMRRRVAAGESWNKILKETRDQTTSMGQADLELARAEVLLQDKRRGSLPTMSPEAKNALRAFNQEMQALASSQAVLGPRFDVTGEKLNLFTTKLRSLVGAGVPAEMALATVTGALGEYEKLLEADITDKLAKGLAEAAISASLAGGNFDGFALSASTVDQQLQSIIKDMALFAGTKKELPAFDVAKFKELSAQLGDLKHKSDEFQMDTAIAASDALGKSFEDSSIRVSSLTNEITKAQQNIAGARWSLAQPNLDIKLVPAYQKAIADAEAVIKDAQPRLIDALGTQVVEGITTEMRDLNLELKKVTAEGTMVFQNETEERIGLAVYEAEQSYLAKRDGVLRQIDLLIEYGRAHQENVDKLVAARAAAEDAMTTNATEAAKKRGEIVAQEIANQEKAASNLTKVLAQGVADVMAGVVAGTREWKDIWGALSDIGVREMTRMFTKTIETKIGVFDTGFRNNLLTEIPDMFGMMADNVLGIFNDLWGAISGSKISGLDNFFSGLLGGGGAGGMGAQAGQVLAGAGGLTLSSIIGPEAAVAAGAGVGAATGGGFTLSSIIGPEAAAQYGASAASNVALAEAVKQLPQGIRDRLAGIFSGNFFSNLLFGAGGGILGSLLGGAVGGRTGSAIGGLGGSLLAAHYGPTVLASLLGSGGGSGLTLASIIGPEAAAQIGAGAGAATGAGAGAGAGAGVGSTTLATLGPTGVGAIVAAAVMGAIQSATQGLATIQGKQSLGAGLANATFDPLGLGGLFGVSPASILGLGGPSKEQLSHRFIGTDILKPLASFKLPDVSWAFRDGLDKTEKAMAAFPELSAKAGTAISGFGTVLGLSLKTAVSNEDDFNYIISTVTTNLGKSGKDGSESIALLAGALKQLNITSEQAALIIDKGFKEGKISLDEYNQAMAGLGQIANVSTDEMVVAMKKNLNDEALALFDRMVAVGIDSFTAVKDAANEAWIGIASGLADNLLPQATQYFDLITALGIKSAEDIKKAFDALSSFKMPEGVGTTPQWFKGGESGKLIYGVRGPSGEFLPQTAPGELDTDRAKDQAEQQKIRESPETPTIPGFQHGGVVTRTEPALVHMGETIVPGGGFADFIATFVRALLAGNASLIEAIRSMIRGPATVAGSVMPGALTGAAQATAAGMAGTRDATVSMSTSLDRVSKTAVEDFTKIQRVGISTFTTIAQTLTKELLDGGSNQTLDTLQKLGTEDFAKLAESGTKTWVNVGTLVSGPFASGVIATFEALVAEGESSAQAIADAFAQALDVTMPEGGGGGTGAGGQWFTNPRGELVYATAGGQPLPAPKLSGEEQQAARQSAPPLPHFALGGVVPGSPGEPVDITAHAGETVVPMTGITDFATMISQVISSALRPGRGEGTGASTGMRQAGRVVRVPLTQFVREITAGLEAGRTVIVPVVDRDKLPETLYRLEREGRYKSKGNASEIPIGNRGSSG